jgi:hypothetical protein
MSFQFRPQRHLLAEALAEVQTFEDRAALQAHLTAQGIGPITSIEKYGDIDRRMDPPWDTHIVMADEVWGQKYPPPGVVMGFTDRAVPE